MCGIVLMGSKNPGVRDVEFFENLLFMDTIRGPHSTGVMSVFRNEGYNTGTHTVIRKAALTGPEFIATKLWDEVASEAHPGYTAGSTIATRPNVMVGHNRWATRGEINAVNAHPFRHGHISLVHNGTLIDQSLLPDYKNFEVDSNNIAYSIAKIGAAETIQKLDGAFTLIWIDDNLHTVNIIRNKERPFHLVELSTGDWFGASEEDMLMWVLKRGKTAPSIKRHFECEVGIQYVFDITNGTFLFKEEIKHELPTFQKTYYYNYSRSTSTAIDDDYDYYYNRQFNQKTETYQERQARQNKEMEQEGLTVKIGDYVTFSVHEFHPYKTYNNNNPTYGKMEGYLEPYDGYVEVMANGILVVTYENNKDALFEGKILEVGKTTGGDLLLTVGSVGVTTTERDMGTAKKLLPVVVTTPVQQISTETMNKNLLDSGLFVEIGDDITFRADDFELKTASTGIGVMTGMLAPCSRLIKVSVVMTPNTVFEKGCLFEAQLLRATLIGGELLLIAKGATRTNIPVQHEVPLETELLFNVITSKTEELTDLASDVPEEPKRLKSGQKVSLQEWGSQGYGECAGCSSHIAWEDAENATLISGYIFCPSCMDEEEDVPFATPKKLATVTSISSYFHCDGCNKRLPLSRKALFNEGGNICDACSKKSQPSVVVSSTSSGTASNKKHICLKNGFYVNQDLWSHMNNCKHCSQPISWDDAPNVQMIGGVPVCHTCTDLHSTK